MSTLADKVLALHAALETAGLPHAFGGALALGWCTAQPRATSDIDLNVFAPPSAVRRVLKALPAPVRATAQNQEELRRVGQSRLWWDTTPVDVFLNAHAFHRQAAARTSLEPFGGSMVPFLACGDLAVFKAFFNRRRDWADLEDMFLARTVDPATVIDSVTALRGAADERVRKLVDLATEISD